jgi:hypothetical protein
MIDARWCKPPVRTAFARSRLASRFIAATVLTTLLPCTFSATTAIAPSDLAHTTTARRNVANSGLTLVLASDTPSALSREHVKSAGRSSSRNVTMGAFAQLPAACERTGSADKVSDRTFRYVLLSAKQITWAVSSDLRKRRMRR